MSATGPVPPNTATTCGNLMRSRRDVLTGPVRSALHGLRDETRYQAVLANEERDKATSAARSDIGIPPGPPRLRSTSLWPRSRPRCHGRASAIFDPLIPQPLALRRSDVYARPRTPALAGSANQVSGRPISGSNPAPSFARLRTVPPRTTVSGMRRSAPRPAGPPPANPADDRPRSPRASSNSAPRPPASPPSARTRSTRSTAAPRAPARSPRPFGQ